MVDRTESSSPRPLEVPPPSMTERLLGILAKQPEAARAATDLLASAFLPNLFLISTPKYTEEQQRALRLYAGTKFTRNIEAMKLVKENILIDGTLDSSGRIIDVKLTDATNKAKLSAWLLFPRGYRGGTGDDAPYHREGFRLWMKQHALSIKKGNLSEAEQFKLDCLVIRSLCDSRLIIGAGKDKALRLNTLERKQLDDAMDRFATRLALSKPADFVKNWKAAYTLLAPLDKYDGDDKTERGTFLAATKGALSYIGTKAKLADTVDKLLESKDSDGADLQKKWIAAMKELPDAKSRAAFQQFILAHFQQHLPRAGAELGLKKALEDPSKRDDPDKVAASIKEEAQKKTKKK